MENQKERIQELLLNEIAEKSLPAGIIFSSFATLVFFYQFEVVQLALPLRIACLMVIFASLLRFLVSRLGREGKFGKIFWPTVRGSVWLNAFSWSCIFAMAAWELDGIGIHYVVAMTIMSSFITGSIVTLSYDKWLFFPFQFLMLVPMFTIVFIKAESDQDYYIFAAVLGFNFLYHILLYFEYRRLLKKRFATQLELESSYETLKNQTAQLVQTSKLAALGEMATGMAHEINNPLAIIALTTQNLDRQLDMGSLDKDLMKNEVSDIQKTVLRISRIIKGLQNISRNSECAAESVIIKDIFDDVLGVCSDKFHKNEVKFDLQDVENLLGFKLLCHRVQISQVLLNLIGNAFDAISDDNPDKKISVELSRNNQFFRISVSNTGDPIDLEVRNKLFQPFFTTKEVGKGTGLGLSISKKIIEAHEGKIYLGDKSEQTTFVIELPISALKDD